ncbi:MAG: serine hydrolase [Lachnospiraceae bacterium]|nr:serine hydrolase [Lachnospiraceae bacterium]
MKKLKKIISMCMLGILMFQNLAVIYAGEKEEREQEVPSGISYDDVSYGIENFVEEHSETTVGMSVAVYDENGVIYRNDFGYEDKENAQIVDENTVFEWGSVSKLYIWISVMQLMEQGKLDLEEDIRTYLPDDFLKNLNFDKKITMIDLMNHQAGFQEMYLGIMTADEEEVVSLEETLRKYQPEQVYEPGTVTAYSNWGAALAAYIVQNVSGMDYVEYVHKNILEPLGMEHTSVGALMQDNVWVKQQREDLKWYDIYGDKIPGNGISYVMIYPAGSATGTMEDFLTFARAVTPNSNTSCPLFQKQETLDLMYTATSYYGSSEVPNNYHGFFANQFAVETLGHAGNTMGCSSMLQFHPESGIGMVVMTNQAHEQVYNYDMYELIFGKFEDSELADIERKVPKGFLTFARSIKEGPLSFTGVIGITEFAKEDLNSWWYQEGDYIYGGYGDCFISTEETVAKLICFFFFLLAGVYGIVTFFGGGLIWSPIQKAVWKRKGIEKKHPFRKWNYAVSFLMTIVFTDVLIMFLRLSNGNATGDMGSVTSYMVQSGIVTVMTILLILCVIFGMVYWCKKGIADKKSEKVKYIITALMAICMLINIILFDMYQFWVI